MNAPVRKRFDRQLFEEFDRSARNSARSYYSNLGYHVVDHPNTYAQDLVASKEGETFCVEVEVKRVWSGATFPYSTVQLPERKKKFCNTPTKFMIMNREMTHAVVFNSETLLELEPVEVPNRYCFEGEMFFQVPLTKCEVVEL